MPSRVEWWIPSTTWLPTEPSDLSVVVPLGEGSPEAIFGESAGEVRGERVEAGDALHPWDPYIVAIPGSVAH